VEEQIKAADYANICVLYASAYGNTASLAQVRRRAPAAAAGGQQG
jgi:hypothetical protein